MTITDEQTEQLILRCGQHMDAATNRGFSDEAAEEMAVTLHSVLLAELLKGDGE